MGDTLWKTILPMEICINNSDYIYVLVMNGIDVDIPSGKPTVCELESDHF